MPSKQVILEALTRSDLTLLIETFDLSVKDKRVKSQLVQALQTAKKVPLLDMLQALSLASLKTLCQDLSLDIKGREKAKFVAALAHNDEPVAASKAKKIAEKPAAEKIKPTKATKVKTTSVTSAKPEESQVMIKAKASKKQEPAVLAEPQKRGRKKKESAPEPVVAAPKAVSPMIVKKAAPVETVPVAQSTPLVEQASAESAPSTPPAVTPKKRETKEERFERMSQQRVDPSTLLSQPMEHQHNPAIVLAEQVKACAHCGVKIPVRKCQVQRCKNLVKIESGNKICAECLFERNALSFVEFDAQLKQENACSHCNHAWAGASATA